MTTEKNENKPVLPDVIGFEINDALERLTKIGFGSPEIKTTRPVFATEPVGKARVVRLRLVEDTRLQVIVAYQDYLKGGA